MVAEFINFYLYRFHRQRIGCMKNGNTPTGQSFRTDLFSTTAHELKTPITTLKLLTQLYIHRNKRGLAQFKLDELQTMDRELDRLTNLVDDLLVASTLGDGKLNLRMQIVDLTALVFGIVKQMRTITQDHKIEFDESITSKMNVISDPNRLTQVLLNLLTNAVKYSPQDTPISVSTKQYKNRVVVSVKNQGEGLSQETKLRVFDRYYQVDKSSTNGMGLGLYITKEIIEKLKGKIWIKSKLNQGSTFAFSLPLSV